MSRGKVQRRLGEGRGGPESTFHTLSEGVSRRGGRIWKVYVWAPRRHQARAVETDKLGPDAPRVDKDMDGEGPWAAEN